MIVRRAGSSWLLVAQADHARLAGELVALVRAPELAGSPRRAEVLRAVAEHDNGWWEEDSAPRLDPSTGGPLDFRALPAPARRELWRRGIERYAAREPYVSALVAGHALRLATGGDEELRAELAARRAELIEAAGRLDEEAASDDRWLRLGDELSLVAATADAALLGAPGWRCEVAEQAERIELRVAPFPWAGPTLFALETRAIPARRYADAVEIGLALLASPRRRRTVRLAPFEADQPGSVAYDSR